MTIWAVLPIKRTDQAKQRLSPAFSPATRQELAIAMFQDVLDALIAAPGLAGIAIVTEDPVIDILARQAGCRVLTEAAASGHTGAVMAAARTLAAECRGGMLALPGDIPSITPAEIATLLAAHRPAPSFTIAPSHDDHGSNAILMSPPNAVPVRFGDDSFHPHCQAAASAGLTPTIVRLAGFAADLDNPDDLHHLAALPTTTRTHAVLSKRPAPAVTASPPRHP